ncbi:MULTISPECIES: hypothetical protein [Pirellulaceae]|uniref:hypothetical protein n=1 Tax=Pirellulaceae TaxID=2691357 RepID=UPI001304BC79|nr:MULTISPECIES: hypothetical protein [Pirellulaceae]
MSVTCDKCGEELMGAVNRCWKCGTQFKRVESAPIPPIRRSPVLAAYVQPIADAPPITIENEVYEAVLEEEPSPASPSQAEPEEHSRNSPPTAFDPAKLDYPSLSNSALAVMASFMAMYSSFAIPLGLVASVLSIHLLNHRRSITRWIGFALGVIALIMTLACLISSVYAWWTGGNLYRALMGTPF